ncbi:hypothetical protein FRC00_005171 [Tulasnella sp. 408]|nr:hypothetical protein FRC00_005171 [Tulasnella sp. 408]
MARKDFTSNTNISPCGVQARSTWSLGGAALVFTESHRRLYLSVNKEPELSTVSKYVGLSVHTARGESLRGLLKRRPSSRIHMLMLRKYSSFGEKAASAVNHVMTEIDGYLFQLPVRRLKESKYFQDMLDSEHLGGSVEGTSDEHPIALGSITSFEMESFVDILDAPAFGKKKQREWKQLAAALHLATMWEFEDVRASLIEDMSQIISKNEVEPLDRVEVSIQCRVNDWLHPAYQELCDRDEGVTTEEAKRLGMDRLAAIYRLPQQLDTL